MSDFQIEITRQGWLEGVDPSNDLCSHGGIRLAIGGVLITDGTEDYGVSESALALLRTLRSSRSRGDELVESMIFHGCGGMLASGCGLGVDWTTLHEGGRVLLQEVVRYDGAGATDAHEFPTARAELRFAKYAERIVKFAREARRPFERTPKRVRENELWEGEYAAFWAEYDELLRAYGDGELVPHAV